MRRCPSLALSVAAATLLAAAVPAQATLIDFDSHVGTGNFSGTPGVAATVTNDYAAQGVVFGRAGLSAGVAVVKAAAEVASGTQGACGLSAAGQIVSVCTGDIYFNFVNPANGSSPAVTDLLSFVVGDSGGDIDGWIFHIYNAAGTEIESRGVQSAARTSQSFNHAGMARVWIEWTDLTSGGYLLDNLQFNAPTAAGNAVPEPGSLALVGLALAGLGLRRRARA